MTDKEAIDILQNCVADYVIGDFCVGKFCPMEEDCKDKDCPYEEAIDVVVNRIKDLEKIEAEHRETNGELREEVEKLERSLCNHDEIIARLEEDNTRKDKIIDEIARFIEVNEFDATLLDEYCPDDYGNCRHPNDSEGCIKCIKEYFYRK